MHPAIHFKQLLTLFDLACVQEADGLELCKEASIPLHNGTGDPYTTL
ncbi:hypothetical protein SCG7086_AX_00040 [Chlamydiales bacterium SCGC AG-110-P3]|nr:hypothetical protein SCG7086_AX_00040 [Chlamydiales bacterium SCGC AG-110-P3]